MKTLWGIPLIIIIYAIYKGIEQVKINKAADGLNTNCRGRASATIFPPHPPSARRAQPVPFGYLQTDTAFASSKLRRDKVRLCILSRQNKE